MRLRSLGGQLCGRGRSLHKPRTTRRYRARSEQTAGRPAPGTAGSGPRPPPPRPDRDRRCARCEAQRAASLIDDSRPTAMRARKAAPSAAPSATADTSTGRPVASAMACIHGCDPGAAAGGHDARHRCSAQFDELTDDEARRLVGGPPQRGGVVGEIEGVQHGAAIRIVERGALAADVRRPHRHPAADRPSPGRPVRPRGPPSRGTARRRCWRRRSGSCRRRCAEWSTGRAPAGPRRWWSTRSGWCHTSPARRRRGRRRPRSARTMASMAPIRQHGVGLVHLPGRRPRSSPPAASARRSRRGRRTPPGPSRSRRTAGYAVAAVAKSITASPARAWLATAGAGQYPAAPGASAAVQRRNSAASPSAGIGWLSGPGARPLTSPYSSPGVSGRPAASTAVIDGTIAETATARASRNGRAGPGPSADPAATPRRRRARAGRGSAPAADAESAPAPSPARPRRRRPL